MSRSDDYKMFSGLFLLFNVRWVSFEMAIRAPSRENHAPRGPTELSEERTYGRKPEESESIIHTAYHNLDIQI